MGNISLNTYINYVFVCVHMYACIIGNENTNDDDDNDNKDNDNNNILCSSSRSNIGWFFCSQ